MSEKEASPNGVISLPATGRIIFSERDGDIKWDSAAKVYRLVPRIRTTLAAGREVELRFNAEDGPHAD